MGHLTIDEIQNVVERVQRAEEHDRSHCLVAIVPSSISRLLPEEPQSSRVGHSRGEVAYLCHDKGHNKGSILGPDDWNVSSGSVLNTKIPHHFGQANDVVNLIVTRTYLVTQF